MIVVVKGDTDPARTVLSQLEYVTDVVELTQSIQFQIAGDRQRQVEVLHRLCDARVNVLEYRLVDESLEDLFLKVTSGNVQ